MPRKIRFFLPEVPVHVVQRGNNRQPVFFAEEDYCTYLERLEEASAAYGCAVHAYVLMTNHIHLLVTPRDTKLLSVALQALGRRYVPYVNNAYRRTGTLWEGRFKASLVQEEDYLLACYRYIELNPVRARMVARPEAYPWSSYRANALGEPDSLLTPHPIYCALGSTESERRSAYRALAEETLEPESLKEIRGCLQTGTPLGNDRFRHGIEQALGVKVGYAARGRPRKVEEASNSVEGQISLDL
jgi:putative transposase